MLFFTQNIQNLMRMRKVIIAQITIGVMYFLNQKDNFRFLAPFRNYTEFSIE